MAPYYTHFHISFVCLGVTVNYPPIIRYPANSDFSPPFTAAAEGDALSDLHQPGRGVGEVLVMSQRVDF